MRHSLCVSAAAVVFLVTGAQADDKLDLIDVRAPVRFGFAYTGITRAPEMSVSWSVAADVLHLSRRLTFDLLLDAEANLRPDLPDTDPRASFSGFGIGAGLFYLTEGEVGLGIESTAWLTFDANQLMGGGLATRVYVYPFYMRIDDAIKHKQGRFSAWVKSSFSLWAMARGMSPSPNVLTKPTPCRDRRSPMPPPTTASAELSTMSCRRIRPRLAPRAARRPISRARETPFASSRFARFAHEISSSRMAPA